MQSIQILAIIFSIGIFTGVVDLIRRRMLKEQYAILWLVSAIILLILSVWRDLLDMIARAVGVAYPPSLLFFMAFFFLLIIVLHFSVIISTLSERQKNLSQEMSLLKTALEQYKKGAENEHRTDNRT